MKMALVIIIIACVAVYSIGTYCNIWRLRGTTDTRIHIWRQKIKLHDDLQEVERKWEEKVREQKIKEWNESIYRKIQGKDELI